MHNYLKERDIIRTLRSRAQCASDVIIGIGDDAAAVSWPDGEAVLSTVDQLVANTHFLDSTPAQALGYKALAISLSDIAAMAATARACLLTIASPGLTQQWLDDFANGFFGLAEQYNVALIGGNCTRGPLAISCTVLASAPANELLKISNAQVGDDIWLLGNVGAAGYAREMIIANPSDNKLPDHNAWYYPEVQLKQIHTIKHLLHSAVDVSDGLYLDLQNLCAASCVGAELAIEQLPLPLELENLAAAVRLGLMLGGGEDYALCATAAVEHRDAILQASCNFKCTRIGSITANKVVKLVAADGEQVVYTHSGWEHF